MRVKVATPRAAGLLLALAMVAAACGSGSSTSVTSGSQAATQADGPQSFEELEFTSPIGEFLGFDFSQSDDREAEFAEMEREAGRATAECMREKGFEYTPRDTSDFASFGPGGEDIPYFSTEWVEKYGFGISTQRFPQSSVGELVGFPDEGFGPGGPDGPVDPNQEYVESLSEGEREAYQEALWGQPPDFGPEGPSEDFVFEPSGCESEAFEAAFNGGPGGNVQQFYEAFGDDLEALEERVRSDPQVVAFNTNVTECVSDAGMEWVDERELYERFERRLNAIQPSGFGPGAEDPFEAAGLDPDEMSERELDEFVRDLNRLDPANLVALGELQAEEIALAKTVIGCGGGPLNEQVTLGEIRVQYEQEFLDRNAEALAEFAPEG